MSLIIQVVGDLSDLFRVALQYVSSLTSSTTSKGTSTNSKSTPLTATSGASTSSSANGGKGGKDSSGDDSSDVLVGVRNEAHPTHCVTSLGKQSSHKRSSVMQKIEKAVFEALRSKGLDCVYSVWNAFHSKRSLHLTSGAPEFIQVSEYSHITIDPGPPPFMMHEQDAEGVVYDELQMSEVMGVSTCTEMRFAFDSMSHDGDVSDDRVKQCVTSLIHSPLVGRATALEIKLRTQQSLQDAILGPFPTAPPEVTSHTPHHLPITLHV